jgi:hypothetical protein
MTLLWLRLRLSKEDLVFYLEPTSHRWKGGNVFIEREAYTENLRRLSLEERHFHEPAVKRVCIWGMGGDGKTILAKAMALEKQVQHYFRNGILWAELVPIRLYRKMSVPLIGRIHSGNVAKRYGRYTSNSLLGCRQWG